MDPIEETDKRKLAEIERRSQRLRRQLLGGLSLLAVALIACVIGLVVNNNNENTSTLKAANNRTTHDLMVALTELQGSCEFYHLLSTLAVQTHQVGTQPSTSKIGVQLIIASRIAYDRAQCFPELDSPSPALIYLAKKYDVAISG